MRFTYTGFVRLLVAMLLLPGLLFAAPIGNTATGSVEGNALNATVTLNRVGGVVSQALAEITPNEVQAGSAANGFVYSILPTISGGDSGVERVEITAPVGYTNLVVNGVEVGGVALTANCPAPGAGEYCATIVAQTMSVLLGDKLTTTLTEIEVDFSADAPAPAGTADFTSLVADGTATLVTVAGDANGNGADANSISVEVLQTQGVVLQLNKAANKSEALVGEVVTYTVEIRNTADFDVLQVTLEDMNPSTFKYVKESVRLDGAPIAEPMGNRPLVFDIGTVPALVDGNANNVADPGEPGYLLLSYQLVVGSGAVPGSHPNSVVAKDFCASCVISNSSTATVEVTIDPLFDLGLIIGKVFEDNNRDDWQDEDEPGVPGAMVALDDGTYVLTDEFGRFHFPAVKPGQRMLKLNMNSLPGARIATERSRIAWVTPGLMVRVNFGVLLDRDLQRIGRPAESGLRLTGEERPLPIRIESDPETRTLIVNGERFQLPSGDVQLGLRDLEETVHIGDDGSARTLGFKLAQSEERAVESWALELLDDGGAPFRTLSGDGQPPEVVNWDGTADDGRRIAAGELYRYRLDLKYEDGTRSASAPRRFGINRSRIVTLSYNADAFEFDSSRLTDRAKQTLAVAAEALRKLGDEPVAIEGHTDSVGSPSYNDALARHRAESVVEQLMQVEALPAERLHAGGFGEDRPLASNESAEGRERNRRVEIRSDVERVDAARLEPIAPGTPSVRIDGEALPPAEDGRYLTRVDASAHEPHAMDVEVKAADGSTASATITIPSISVDAPTGEFLLPHGATGHGCTSFTSRTTGAPDSPSVLCRIEGRTDPGNLLRIDDQPLLVGADGRFSAEHPLQLGQNRLQFTARNPQGFTRLTTLDVEVSDKDADGRSVRFGDPLPALVVQLPPQGETLRSPALVLVGSTTAGNTLTANGVPVPISRDGGFTHAVELPAGESTLALEVRDAEGHSGTIERDVRVAENDLFLMVFGEGRFGKLEADGQIEGAGLHDADDYYVEGRLAFYLKGRIKGKYLITSALDTGKNEMEYLFRNIDIDDANLLLRNLDPDKFYPIYGDSSTVVYDAQSQGKFYLALDSDTVHALIGNYPIVLNDTELAAYQRTLYGGRFAYRSAARTEFGEPFTQVIVFGAELEQIHMRDELQATGGSLYYLSREDVIEGSEQVTIVVREQNTGLVLSRQLQRPNADYTIKYPEGRIMFHRPISSVLPGNSLLGEEILQGHRVSIQVDYEARADSFDETTGGARVRQQLGDRLSVGGTYVEDELAAGSYELTGVDSELRLGQNSRITAEYAESSGTDAVTNLSTDGGLTYVAAPVSPLIRGEAWKAAVDFDLGEFFDNPDRYRVGAYYKKLESGFISSGNLLEQGTEKSGVHGSVRAGAHDTILFNYDWEERLAALAGTAQDLTVGSLEWKHARRSWGLDVAYFDKQSEDSAGNSLLDSGLGGARLWKRFGEKLTTRLERQETISGLDNDQTRVGVQYQALESLLLGAEATDGDRGESASAGATLKIGESEIYLTERLVEEQVGESSSTVLGARSPLGESGKVYTEYQQEELASGGWRTVSLVGMQQQWDPAPGFRFVLSGEMADTHSATGPTERHSIGTQIAYVRPELWKVLTRNEIRLEDGTIERQQLFSSSQFDYTLDEDFSLLARYRYSKTKNEDAGTVEAKLDERVVGVAYRPVAHDRFNSIAKYTRLFDMRPLALGAVDSSSRTMDVISIDSALRINRRVEWLSKGAIRWQDEQVMALPTVETETYLTIQHFNITVRNPIDFGVEYRILVQSEADDRREGWLGEITWKVTRDFRLGGGYNFTDFSDDEFSQNDYSVEGWFIRVQGKY